MIISRSRKGNCCKASKIRLEIVRFQIRMEVTMSIKILIKRQFKKDSTLQAFDLLRNFRQDAMSRSGYISGETWINHYDSCQITVVSTWQTVEDWIEWEESDERVAHEDKLQDILKTPAQFEIYDVGGGSG
jgi:heme-degrading monooxygenase HmoA